MQQIDADESLFFQQAGAAGHLGVGKPGVAAEFVEADAAGGADALREIRQALHLLWRQGGPEAFPHGGLEVRGLPPPEPAQPQGDGQVLRSGHGGCQLLPDQQVAALRADVVDASRHGEYLPPVAVGQPGGDHPAALDAGLHEHGGAGEPGADAVAAQDGERGGRRAGRVIRHEGAAGRGAEAFREGAVPPGVHFVDAHRADADRRQAAGEGRGVCGDVHAYGHPADNHRFGRCFGKCTEDALAAFTPVEALVPGAHDGHGRPLPEQFARGRGAADVQQQRRVGAFPQGGGVAFVEDVQELVASPGKPLQFFCGGVERGGTDPGRPVVIRAEQFQALPFGKREHGLGGTEGVDQAMGKLRLIAEDGVERDGARQGKEVFVHFS